MFIYLLVVILLHCLVEFLMLFFPKVPIFFTHFCFVHLSHFLEVKASVLIHFVPTHGHLLFLTSPETTLSECVSDSAACLSLLFSHGPTAGVVYPPLHSPKHCSVFRFDLAFNHLELERSV